ncbi:MAG: phosphatidate cytidylyltransferase [Flavipsychrobacter sp.]|nr:phosphatidate cytidylyltransferase [Flavipsychrobacter sp.]
MPLNWPTFFTRLGSAIIFCIIMMTGLLWNDTGFVALVSVIQLLCFREYFSLVRKIQPDTYWPDWMENTVQVICFVWVWLLSSFFKGLTPAPFFFLLFFPILILLLAVLDKRTALAAALQALAGLFYIFLPMVMLVIMYRREGYILPLALILMLWTNDTMAYLVGSFIGKTPFSPISPKKTWEGTAGGALLTIAGAAAFGYYTGEYRMVDWIMLALCASVAGTAGDLLESKLKRLAGVKDSGTMMPGHGGALDRFDSLLVATPFAFVYAYLFMF